MSNISAFETVTSFWGAKSNCHLFEIFLWAFLWLVNFCLYSFLFCRWHFFFLAPKTLLNLSALLEARLKTEIASEASPLCADFLNTLEKGPTCPIGLGGWAWVAGWRGSCESLLHRFNSQRGNRCSEQLERDDYWQGLMRGVRRREHPWKADWWRVSRL